MSADSTVEQGQAKPTSVFDVRVRRVYEARQQGDGRRVLVDRMWPRGMTKERADLDEWLKTVAPSTALRKWYGHDPARFLEFERRYRAELAVSPQAVSALRRLDELAEEGTLTLLTATKNEQLSEAAVLARILRR
jgi:uncharacterized protein YeaO (DUF488 family)